MSLKDLSNKQRERAELVQTDLLYWKHSTKYAFLSDLASRNLNWG
jgi:hypothetical protein